MNTQTNISKVRALDSSLCTVVLDHLTHPFSLQSLRLDQMKGNFEAIKKVEETCSVAGCNSALRIHFVHVGTGDVPEGVPLFQIMKAALDCLGVNYNQVMCPSEAQIATLIRFFFAEADIKRLIPLVGVGEIQAMSFEKSMMVRMGIGAHIVRFHETEDFIRGPVIVMIPLEFVR